MAGENVEPALLAEVATLAYPPRVIGVFRQEDLRHSPLPDVGLALWRVGDPGNVGTLVRAADALGPAFVATSEGTADPTGPKALRGSMGALFRVPFVGFDDAPGRRVALVARGGRPLEELDLSAPTTFVLGAEREGLPEEVPPALRGTGDDSARGRRGFPERRPGRRDRSLRALAQAQGDEYLLAAGVARGRFATQTVSSRPM